MCLFIDTRSLLFCCLFLIYQSYAGPIFADEQSSSTITAESPHTVDESTHEAPHEEHHFQVAHFDWPDVGVEISIVMWILFASIFKMVFNLSKRFARIFPDSALMILLGLIAGTIMYYTEIEPAWFRLESHIFFIYLLPPIIFDAGYSMPVRALFENIFSITTFAVFGTIWNMMSLGLILYGFNKLGWYAQDMDLLHVLTFTAIVSAVDPVAVIAVFESIHVNETLYINVFGESLFNDAIAVVLYRICLSYTDIGPKKLINTDYIYGFASFFVVALGGIVVGILGSIVCGFVTRFSAHVSVLNAAFAFLIPYLAYLAAEMVGFSAIMAILTCAIIMKPYIKENLSYNSTLSMKYFTKMLAVLSETVVFLFLGLSTVTATHDWDTHFVILAVIFCFITRFIGVVVLSAILNRYRIHKFSKVDQFVMGYSGLRGAVAYGLVESLPEIYPAKNTYITAAIGIILFTVFVQGSTIRPIVNWLRVEKNEEREKTMSEYTLERVLDNTMAGMEAISYHRGQHLFRDTVRRLNNKWLRPLLVRKSQSKQLIDSKLLRAYTKILINDAIHLVHGEKKAESHKIRAMQRKLDADQIAIDTIPETLDINQLMRRGVDHSLGYTRDPTQTTDLHDIRILNSAGLPNALYRNPNFQSGSPLWVPIAKIFQDEDGNGVLRNNDRRDTATTEFVSDAKNSDSP